MDFPSKKSTTRPKVLDMVIEAIATLGERKGSSLQAIKKFISSNYSVDVQKLSVHIKKQLKSAVERGEIIQTSGKGANGSFKINKQKKPDVAERKVSKVISLKPLENLTSTPKRTLKPKKAAMKPLHTSPVKKVQTADKQVHTVLSSPKTKETVPLKVKKSKISLPTKVKTSKPAMVIKVKKPKASLSPSRKLKNVETSPRLLKPKATGKTNAKKPVKLAASTKRADPKKAETKTKQK